MSIHEDKINNGDPSDAEVTAALFLAAVIPFTVLLGLVVLMAHVLVGCMSAVM